MSLKRKKFGGRMQFHRSERNFTGTQEIWRTQEIWGCKQFSRSARRLTGARNCTKTQDIQRRTYEDAISKNATNLTATNVQRKRIEYLLHFERALQLQQISDLRAVCLLQKSSTSSFERGIPLEDGNVSLVLNLLTKSLYLFWVDHYLHRNSLHLCGALCRRFVVPTNFLASWRLS